MVNADERTIASSEPVWYQALVSTQLRSLEFARYRGFRDLQSPALERLNLVYGTNNSGKSAFVRVPALLAASRSPGRIGLDFGQAVRGAGFREVRWRGDLPDDADPELVLGIGLSDGSTWRWTLDWQDSSATSTIQSVTVGIHGNSETFAGGLAFDGIVPRMGANSLLDHARDGLAAALDGVIWLEAKREAPSREGIPRGAPGAFTSTGEGIAALVAADTKLRNAVSAWFQQNAQCAVEVEQLGSDRQRIVLRPTGASFDIAFPDAGEGLQQAFAVVAALEHLRRDGGLLCVEEPESHLHPKLQRALALLTVDVLSSQPQASVLVETHSEVFLLAALNAATAPLEGLVRIFWVESDSKGVATIENVELDKEGRAKTAQLEHAFDTMGVMRRELIQARKGTTGGG